MLDNHATLLEDCRVPKNPKLVLKKPSFPEKFEYAWKAFDIGSVSEALNGGPTRSKSMAQG